MPTFRVLLFSLLKHRVGESLLRVDMDAPATVRDLLDKIAADHPALAPYRTVVRMAVNHEYASEDRPVAPGDEIALITPVSGG